MSEYPYTFHRKSRRGTVPTGSATLQADSIEAATAQVELMTWPENAVLVSIEVSGRADVVVTQ